MINVTPALKEHLVKSFGMKAEATDEEAQKLAATKFASGELTSEKLKELATSGAKDKAVELADTIATKTATAVSGALAGPLAAIAEALKGSKAPETKTEPVPDTKAKEDADVIAFQKRIDDMEAAFNKRISEMKPEEPVSGAPKAADLFKLGIGVEKEDSPVNVHVKGVQSKYGMTKTKAYRNAKTDHPEHRLVRRHGCHGAEMENPSEFEKVMGAVWFKFQVAPQYLTENDRLVLTHILHKEKFVIHGDTPDEGVYNPDISDEPRLLTAKERHDMLFKATVLINDATSGGSYATPEFFDTNFILLPILGRELAPLTNIIDVPRGSAAQNFQMGNPSWTSGSTEGSAVTPFTTDSFIANKDFTFFRAAGAIRLGINFMQDAVPGMAEAVMGRIMAKGDEWLDEQVAIGDGTTEPEGIFTASGTGNVTIGTPTTGPYVIGDLTELYFAVTKAYRTNFPLNRAAFVMTDSAYYLIKSIATGVTGDTRLIFGMNLGEYRLFDHPVAIVGTGLTNDQIAFVQCGGYRLYRRQGARFVRSSEGSTNILSNMHLIAYDMRYGGGLERGGYAAVTTSGIP